MDPSTRPRTRHGFFVEIPFVEWLGMELVRFEPGLAQIDVLLRDELTNTWGVAHGGLMMTLLDVAMAHAARSPAAAGGEAMPGVVTVEMKTTFIRPGWGRMACTGTLLHRTASMAFTEGRVADAEDVLLAHATGTFKFARGLAVGGEGGRRIQKPAASD